MEGVQGQADLLQVIRAFDAMRRCPGRHYRRQQQRDEQRDDSDHNQQLDERKTV
jgi:hypothetical protein